MVPEEEGRMEKPHEEISEESEKSDNVEVGVWELGTAYYVSTGCSVGETTSRPVGLGTEMTVRVRVRVVWGNWERIIKKIQWRGKVRTWQLIE